MYIELQSLERCHEYIFVEKVGFILLRRRRGGRNIHWGGSANICAVIRKSGALHHHAILGPYNICLLIFLFGLWDALFGCDRQGELPIYVMVWGNKSFTRGSVSASNVWLPPCSTFPQPSWWDSPCMVVESTWLRLTALYWGKSSTGHGSGLWWHTQIRHDSRCE